MRRRGAHVRVERWGTQNATCACAAEGSAAPPPPQCISSRGISGTHPHTACAINACPITILHLWQCIADDPLSPLPPLLLTTAPTNHPTSKQAHNGCCSGVVVVPGPLHLASPNESTPPLAARPRLDQHTVNNLYLCVCRCVSHSVCQQQQAEEVWRGVGVIAMQERERRGPRQCVQSTGGANATPYTPHCTHHHPHPLSAAACYLLPAVACCSPCPHAPGSTPGIWAGALRVLPPGTVLVTGLRGQSA